jgi:hypothetical protein
MSGKQKVFIRKINKYEFYLLPLCPFCGYSLLWDEVKDGGSLVEYFYDKYCEPILEFNLFKKIKDEYVDIWSAGTPILDKISSPVIEIMNTKDLAGPNRYDDMINTPNLGNKYVVDQPDKPYEVMIDIFEGPYREHPIVSVNPKCRWKTDIISDK